jgi:hypothetical protein
VPLLNLAERYCFSGMATQYRSTLVSKHTADG